MKDFFSLKSSTELVKFLVQGDESQPKERGIARKLSDALKCHPTFISQVTLGKAHLNSDQAVRFAEFFDFDDDQTQYLLDLVSLDRSSTPSSRAFFQRRLAEQREKRGSLTNRFKDTHSLDIDDELRYYDCWLYQALHMLTQCEGPKTSKVFAQALSAPVGRCEEILMDLIRMGLVEQKGNAFACIKPNLHQSKTSPSFRRSHTVWRNKTSEVMAASKDLPGMHYSSLFTSDPESLVKLKELTTRYLEDSRKIILQAPSQKLAVMCIDLYSF